jgi:hypothetical protein
MNTHRHERNRRNGRTGRIDHHAAGFGRKERRLVSVFERRLTEIRRYLPVMSEIRQPRDARDEALPADAAKQGGRRP